MCVTPSDLSAQTFARYGTVEGLRTCPSPCREMSARGCPSSSERVIGPEGAPKGVSTRRTSPPPSAPSASPSPVPPITPITPRAISDPPRRSFGERAAYRERPAARPSPALGTALSRGRPETSRAPKKKTPAGSSASGRPRKMRQRPTLPHGFPCSTIGSGGLNFRVRDGNGCDPTDIATAKHGKERRRSLLKTEYEG